MRTNTLKQRLKAGKAAFGAMITFPSPPIVEMLGYMGFDWVLIDNEHGSITVDTAEESIRAAELTGVAPIGPVTWSGPSRSRMAWLTSSTSQRPEISSGNSMLAARRITGASI